MRPMAKGREEDERPLGSGSEEAERPLGSGSDEAERTASVFSKFSAISPTIELSLQLENSGFYFSTI
jgi:hypothetical protein